MMMIFYVGPSQFSFYITQDIDPTISSLKIGIVMAAVMVAAAIVGALYKQIKKALNFQWITIIGFGLLGIGFVAISLARVFSVFVVAAIIGGLGFGFALPNFSLYLVSNTTTKNRGKVVSGYNAMWYTGEALSPFIFEPVREATSYSTIFLIAGVVYFALLIIPIALLIIYYTNKKQQALLTEQV